MRTTQILWTAIEKYCVLDRDRNFETVIYNPFKEFFESSKRAENVELSLIDAEDQT